MFTLGYLKNYCHYPVPTAHISYIIQKKNVAYLLYSPEVKTLSLSSLAHLLCRKLQVLPSGIKTGSSSEVTQNPSLFLAQAI